MTQRQLRFSLLTLLTLSIVGCNSQTKNNNFKFEYLKANNKKIKDSAKLKLNLYFNNYPLDNVNHFLENIESYKKKDIRTDNLMKALNYIENRTHTPFRLKSIKVDNEYVIDSIFYENFEVPQIIFIAENYYDQVENLRLTKLNYDKNINSIIKFGYDYDLPITYSDRDNVLSFNIGFRNISAKDIKSFEGKLILSNTQNEELLNVNLTSDVFPQNIYPNPLKAVGLDRWKWSVLSEINTSILGLKLKVSDYKKKQIKDNYMELIMTFIPTKIYFKDETILYQSKLKNLNK